MNRKPQTSLPSLVPPKQLIEIEGAKRINERAKRRLGPG